MYMLISSAQNQWVKTLRLLSEKSRERKQSGVFVIDGWKEIQMALEAGYEIQQLFFRTGSVVEFAQTGNTQVFEIEASLFDKLSYRGATSGALAIVEARTITLENLQLSKNPLLLIADAVEKPGNIGAMLRTVDATGADALICCDTGTDAYNPNIIRSSVGCVFTTQFVLADRNSVYKWLKEKGIKIWTTSLKASIPYTEADFSEPSAIVLGTEATGVDSLWEEYSDANIILPMLGKNDSLNVSNTAAVVLYEALRQRKG